MNVVHWGHNFWSLVPIELMKLPLIGRFRR